MVHGPLYHGTAKCSVEKILADGIRPTSQTWPPAVLGKPVEIDWGKHAYLTSSLVAAKYWAETKARSIGSTPAIVVKTDASLALVKDPFAPLGFCTSVIIPARMIAGTMDPHAVEGAYNPSLEDSPEADEVIQMVDDENESSYHITKSVGKRLPETGVPPVDVEEGVSYK